MMLQGRVFKGNLVNTVFGCMSGVKNTEACCHVNDDIACWIGLDFGLLTQSPWLWHKRNTTIEYSADMSSDHRFGLFFFIKLASN